MRKKKKKKSGRDLVWKDYSKDGKRKEGESEKDKQSVIRASGSFQ